MIVVRWFLVRAEPLGSDAEENTLEAFFGTCTDIDDQKVFVYVYVVSFCCGYLLWDLFGGIFVVFFCWVCVWCKNSFSWQKKV